MRPRVLIANDEMFQLVILEALFEKAGFKITTAINGQEAYEHYIKSLDDPSAKFDLVVLDLCMPVTDGFEACKRILSLHINMKRLSMSQYFSAQQSTQPLIVAVSGFIDERIEQKAKSSGFKMVFESPLSEDQIKNQLLKFVLKRKEMEAELNRKYSMLSRPQQQMN